MAELVIDTYSHHSTVYLRVVKAQKAPNKRILSDWFSAALQTSRKCGR